MLTRSTAQADALADAEGRPLGTHFSELARHLPDELALVAPDGRRTWRHLNRNANRLAHALRARGVLVGDFVTIALPNEAGLVESVIACWKIGAVPQPVSPRSPQLELQAIIDLAKPKVVVSSRTGSGVAGQVGIEDLIAESADTSDPAEHVAPYLKAPTSGGSTGRPKLIVSGSPGRVAFSTPAMFQMLPTDVVMIPAPLYHNGALSAAFAALVMGAPVVIMRKFEPMLALDLIKTEQVSWLYLVPTMMSRIWRLPEEVKRTYEMESLRMAWHMAAPCARWLKEAWMEWIGPHRLYELYGGTESQSITTISGTEWLSHKGSVGKPLFGEICILGTDGEKLPRGQVGEVYLRTGQGAEPTYHYIGATARNRGDWESLGDIGWMDDDGYLYIVDRRHDMILVGGANVYPAEVESAIEEHPLVISCGVVGIPDEDLGQTVHAVVQAKPGLDRDLLMEHLSQRLSPPKWPRTIDFVEHPVRDDAGKVRRSQLVADKQVHEASAHAPPDLSQS